jgi:hypothetical protein
MDGAGWIAPFASQSMESTGDPALDACARRRRMKMNQLMIKFSISVALVGAVAVTLPSASHAFGEHQYYYQHEDDGSSWSYYRGYFSNENEPTVEGTRPGTQARTNRAPRRNVTEPAQAPARPSCLVGSDGSCR